MKYKTRNVLVLFFCLSSIHSLYALGAADNIATFTVTHADDITKAVIMNADDLVQAGLLHADDVMRVGVVHADDIARLGVRHADDIIQLGLRNGDDLIYDFSKIHLRAHNVNYILNNVDDIALKGIPRNAFVARYGKDLATDISAYTGGQYRKIQSILRGDPVLPASGIIKGQKLKGEEFIQALGNRANRINDFLNTQTISNSTKLLRGDNLPETALTSLYSIGDIKGKTLQEVADMIKANGKTLNSSALTSTSLPNVDVSLIDELAIYGWKGTTNNYKIIRQIDAPAGTKGFNISQLSTKRGQQEFLMPRGLKTQVTNAVIDTVTMNGQTYNVIRVFETIMP